MRSTSAVFALLFLSSCMHVSIFRTEKSSAAESAANADVHIVELDSFAWGFVPKHLPSEKEICQKSRIDSVQIGMNATDVFLTMITVGVYVPHRVEITCATALTDSH